MNVRRRNTIRELIINAVNIDELNHLDEYTSLVRLVCSGRGLTTIPGPLPRTLLILWCDNNSLVELPRLPDTLEILACQDNMLIKLPRLPDALQTLRCSNNQLTRLPMLPINLSKLLCTNNTFELEIYTEPLEEIREWQQHCRARPGRGH